MKNLRLQIPEPLFEYLERRVEEEARGETPEDYLRRLLEEDFHRFSVEQWEANLMSDRERLL